MFTTYMFVVHVRWKKNMALFEYALILMNMYLYYYQRTNVREVLHLVAWFLWSHVWMMHHCWWKKDINFFCTDTTFESGQKVVLDPIWFWILELHCHLFTYINSSQSYSSYWLGKTSIVHNSIYVTGCMQ